MLEVKEGDAGNILEMMGHSKYHLELISTFWNSKIVPLFLCIAVRSRRARIGPRARILA